MLQAFAGLLTQNKEIVSENGHKIAGSRPTMCPVHLKQGDRIGIVKC